MTYYLRMSFFYCNFAAYSIIAQRRIYIFCSPRRGGVQKCGGIQDIINSVLNALCFDSSESGKFKYPKQCDTKMPMVCIYTYAHRRVPINIYTYGVGFGVAVLIQRQYQSLDEWNSKIAVPLFCCIYVLLKYGLA